MIYPNVIKSIHRSLVSLLVAAVSGAALAQVQYRVTELPPLPGYRDSAAVALNDLGDVVGSCNPMSGDGVMATVWRAGVPTALGKDRKGIYSYATAINNSGVIAGEGDDGDYRPNVLVFRGGKATFIDSGANNSHAIAVLNTGKVVGDYLKGFGGTAAWNPAIWTPDRDKFRREFLPQYVAPVGGFSNVYANGVNNLGVAVGQVSSSTEWSARAGLWSGDSKHTLTLLDPLPGQWDSYANAINDHGLVVGISDLGSFSTTPVVWQPGARTPTALPLLPGEIHGQAFAVNNLGHVLGSHGNAPAAWIDGNLIDLQTSLDASGAGWTLSVVYRINNVGQIVGSGFHNGQFRGFVLTPVALP